MMRIGQISAAAAATMFLTGFTTEQITYQNVPINSNDNGELLEIPAVLVKPDGDGPFAAVVLLHHCGGPDRQSLIFWPDFLTGLGYVTLTPDSHTPRGLRNCGGPVNLGRLENRIEVERDAYGALEYLGHRPFIDVSRVAVMGFSMGGIVISSMLHRPEVVRVFRGAKGYSSVPGHAISPSGFEFAAAIGLYAACAAAGGGQSSFPPALEPLPGEPKLPWLVINGSKEKSVYTDICRRKERQSPDLVEFHELEGVYHAFDNPNNTVIRKDPVGNEMLYSREAVEQSKILIEHFLARHLTE